MPIAFEGLHWFGGEKPRAIVARVKADPALMDLQASQERRLRRLGLPPETRNFTPHVTLARLRSVSPFAVADYLGVAGRLACAEASSRRVSCCIPRGTPSAAAPIVVEADYPLS